MEPWEACYWFAQSHIMNATATVSRCHFFLLDAGGLPLGAPQLCSNDHDGGDEGGTEGILGKANRRQVLPTPESLIISSLKR